MFWRFNFQGSTLDQLLQKPETTLENILSQPEMIQELKTQNAKLISFVAQPDKVQIMLNYISKANEEYSAICSEVFALELPQFATIMFGAPHLIESFIKEMLDKEWTNYEGLSFIKVVSSILYKDPKTSLDILKKIKIGSKEITFLESVCQKISSGETVLYELLLKISAMDEVLKEDFIVTWFKNEKLIEFLVSQLHFRNISEPEGLERISSATACLLDFFAVAQAISVVQVPLHENHIILDVLSSPWIIQSLDFINEYYKNLKSNTLDKSCASQQAVSTALTSLLGLINDVVRRNYLDFVLSLHQQALTIRMEEFTEQDVMVTILKDPKRYLLDVTGIGVEMCKYFELFTEILKTPISKFHRKRVDPDQATTTPDEVVSKNGFSVFSDDYIQSSVGTVKLFGMERYRVCELIVEMLRMVVDEDQILIHEKLKDSIKHHNDEHPDNKININFITMQECIDMIVNKFIESKIFVQFIELFFEHPWNNIYHSLVLDVITYIFDANVYSPQVERLVDHIMKDSSLISMICQAVQMNKENTLKPRMNRLPYMGHLTLISEILVKHFHRHSEIRVKYNGNIILFRHFRKRYVA
eukprot:NODE_60_length_27201_cov_1.043318.p4 type:complete len:588 gc:universal NODE_60_length_27201_cov_1.043318:3796-5559(+)